MRKTGIVGTNLIPILKTAQAIWNATVVARVIQYVGCRLRR